MLMHNLFLSVLTVISGPVTALVSNYSLPKQYFLHMDPVKSGLTGSSSGGTTMVSYANGTLWIGAIRQEIYAEPLNLLTSAPSNLVFTSYHSASAGTQYVEVAPGFTGPLLTSEPFGGFNGPPFVISGFGYALNGQLQFDGKSSFIGCKNAQAPADLETYQLWFQGNGAPPKGLNCTSPLYLYRDLTCSVTNT
ncbi:hypothetical protein MMC25_005808 [Agyrium rufum]|nr:hypothetical protein [Agyrium rufum]